MKINKQQFIEALELVKPGLAAKEIIEQSTSFVFRAGQVITYNDEVAVHAPVGLVTVRHCQTNAKTAPILEVLHAVGRTLGVLISSRHLSRISRDADSQSQQE